MKFPRWISPRFYQHIYSVSDSISSLKIQAVILKTKQRGPLRSPTVSHAVIQLRGARKFVICHWSFTRSSHETAAKLGMSSSACASTKLLLLVDQISKSRGFSSPVGILLDVRTYNLPSGHFILLWNIYEHVPSKHDWALTSEAWLEARVEAIPVGIPTRSICAAASFALFWASCTHLYRGLDRSQNRQNPNFDLKHHVAS